MEERRRTGAQPASTPGSGEIVGYGLLAAAVAAGVLYLDGQGPRDIAVIAGAILGLLATLVLIAPRLGVPQEKDDAVPRVRHDRPPEAANDTVRQYGRRAERSTGTEPPVATTAMPGSEEVMESGSNSPAGSAKPGRRAKRGRRRR